MTNENGQFRRPIWKTGHSEETPPYELIQLRGEERLVKVKRFPQRNISSGSENLAAAFSEYSQIEGLIAIVGLPRSGKSYMKEVVDWHIENMFIGRHQPNIFGSKTWEEDGEEKARARGKITTLREDPFSDEELQYSNEELKKGLFQSLTNNRLTTLEVTGITRIGEIGRDIGVSTLDEAILRRTKQFKELKPYEVRLIGLVGGPLLHEIMLHYRSDMKRTRSLKEGQHIAQLYGKEIPTSRAAWEAMKAEGASYKQIALIEHVVDDLIDYLEDMELIPKVPDEHVEFFYDEHIGIDAESLKLNPQRIKNILKREMRTANLMQYKFHSLRVPENHLGIFFNNPDLSDLHIQPNNFDELAHRLSLPLVA